MNQLKLCAEIDRKIHQLNESMDRMDRTLFIMKLGLPLKKQKTEVSVNVQA